MNKHVSKEELNRLARKAVITQLATSITTGLSSLMNFHQLMRHVEKCDKCKNKLVEIYMCSFMEKGADEKKSE